ncbi:hypothetical protein [Paenibacillus sp. MMS18-CY102]|uniref:hypothetical protein n=1 Tax=Paenibacillus sp. MMS18-CY102 TaxID=2682849 RepID=UPI0013654F54|nr:hypothetical protein [Paenibacillus sp. MMS18-CY102]MWC29660.1 hypothetical protein [Paenibacillus sp. MMS18-CY102]
MLYNGNGFEDDDASRHCIWYNGSSAISANWLVLGRSAYGLYADGCTKCNGRLHFATNVPFSLHRLQWQQHWLSQLAACGRLRCGGLATVRCQLPIGCSQCQLPAAIPRQLPPMRARVKTG